MTAMTFSPLAAARNLEAAGFTHEQAEAAANAMRDAAGADRSELVTKGELHRALWIQGAALISAQVATAGFVVHLLSRQPP